MAVITYWLHIIGVLLLVLIPGLAVALRIRELDDTEKLAAAFGFSFIISLMIVPLFALKLDYLGRLLILAILLVSLVAIRKNMPNIILNKEVKFILLVLTLGIASKIFLQTLWEYPVLGGDWFGHAFTRPYQFEVGKWAPDRDRTPLFSLLIYVYHHFFDISLEQYWLSQVISVWINSVFVIPAYLIAKKTFGSRVAKTSALFMLFAPYLIFNSIYTWPKNAAMYSVLMLVYLVFFSNAELKLRYSLAGFFAGLGFLFHPYALFYIGIVIFLLVWKEKIYKRVFSKNPLRTLIGLPYLTLALLALVLPYFLWVYSYYGTISTSKIVYYPFAVDGYESALGDTKELFDKFYATPVSTIIRNRMINIITTFTPATIPLNPVVANHPGYSPVFYYSLTCPGALSFLMYLAVFVWFVKYIKGTRKTDKVLVGFLVIAAGIVIVFYGWREWGLLSGWLHPTVPILIAIGFNEVYYWTNKGMPHKKSIRFGALNRLVVHLRNRGVYVIFIAAAFEDVFYGITLNKFYHTVEGIQGLSAVGKEIAPDFQVSNFVSVHFLLDSNTDLLANFIISAAIISVCIFLYKKR